MMVGTSLLLMLATLATPTFGAAWQATPVSEEPTLPPIVWELRSIAGPAETTEVAEPTAYTIQFLPGRQLLIRADCNRGSGSYRRHSASMAIGPIRTTRMRCAPGSIDQWFLSAVQKAEQWSFVDDQLLLQDSVGSTTLTFSPQLSGVIWEWQGLQTGNDREMTPPKPNRYWITFLADELVRWEAECASGQGTYRVAGASLDVQLGDAGANTCPSSVLNREFVQMLEEATSHQFQDGDLYLSLPADAGVARFVARPLDSETASAGSAP